jgi:hypothetical protein
MIAHGHTKIVTLADGQVGDCIRRGCRGQSSDNAPIGPVGALLNEIMNGIG